MSSRGKIRAAALDAKHVDLAPAVVALARLDRGIATAPHDERGLGADEARRVHEEIETFDCRRFRIIPSGPHRGPTIPRDRERLAGCRGDEGKECHRTAGG
jgi:hypothetical protein